MKKILAILFLNLIINNYTYAFNNENFNIEKYTYNNKKSNISPYINIFSYKLGKSDINFSNFKSYGFELGSYLHYNIKLSFDINNSRINDFAKYELVSEVSDKIDIDRKDIMLKVYRFAYKKINDKLGDCIKGTNELNACYNQLFSMGNCYSLVQNMVLFEDKNYINEAYKEIGESVFSDQRQKKFYLDKKHEITYSIKNYNFFVNLTYVETLNKKIDLTVKAGSGVGVISLKKTYDALEFYEYNSNRTSEIIQTYKNYYYPIYNIGIGINYKLNNLITLSNSLILNNYKYNDIHNHKIDYNAGIEFNF
jgi:hypothetical protein